MSRGAVVADLVRTQAKGLKMPAVAPGFEALARQAHQERWSYEEYLHEVLVAEAASRAESAVRQRLHEARFPELKTLDQFDVTAAEGVEAPQVVALARGAWIDQAHNVLLVGPIGTGKTHLGIALGVEAARQRRRVGFGRTAELVRALLEAKDARSADSSAASPASIWSSSTSWGSSPSTAPAASCSSRSSPSATNGAACSGPATSPSASGRRSGGR